MTTRNLLIYWLKYGGYRITIKQAIARAQEIIVPSYFVSDQLLAHYPDTSAKISVVYEGVSAPYTQTKKEASTQSNAKTLARYQLTAPFFIYTGSAYPSKDLPTLLHAFQKLLTTQQGEKTQLIIACARSRFWKQLQELVKELHIHRYVRLPGRVPDADLHILYQHARAFVTPSRMEGFGLPGIEALAKRVSRHCK